jgi:hypothetical protein
MFSAAAACDAKVKQQMAAVQAIFRNRGGPTFAENRRLKGDRFGAGARARVHAHDDPDG